mgnify:CR=1 FL=1
MDKDFLKGKRIAITALELENKEHRGIASFIKSSIHILSKYGAEVYLITGFDCSQNFKNYSNKDIENIFVNEIYNFLLIGKDHRQIFNSNTKYKFKLILELSINLFELFFNNFLFKYKLYTVNKDLKYKNFLNSKSQYLEDIKGFISIKNIFHLCRLRSMRFMFKDPILNINKEDIDLIISSNPLSLKKKGNKSADLIQIIHDAIPIQVSNHPENKRIFFNRLKDVHKNCKCLYVSKESRKIVKNILKIKNSKSKKEIIYPLPSLQIEQLEKAYGITSIRSINKSFILFNSSIVKRKKLENAINYFLNSNLPRRNFMFCIAGKIHKSKYCNYIVDLCKNHRNILLLDYVSETEKAWLFLNSSLLISTSSCEGFGIPLLDALSLNLSSLATSIPSHQEIKDLSKNNKINLLKQEKQLKWIDKLNSITKFDIKNNEAKRQRINHFKDLQNSLERDFLFKIGKFLT